jgi:diaminopimelate epimerase
VVRFTKMQGAGNDFVVFDATKDPIALTPQQIRRLADRHFGIGCDQVLIVEPADDAAVDFVYRIYNADGNEVEQCGNGARAFVRFVRDRGLTTKDRIRVKTRSGVIEPQLLLNGDIRVNMGRARLLAAEVPFNDRGLSISGASRAPDYPLTVAGRLLSVGVASLGNPHVVVTVPDVSDADVATLGPLLEHHERFPERVNAGFMQVIDHHRIALRVWERGAGETLACGSGACAAAVLGIARGLLVSPVTVKTQGGPLVIEWDGGESSPVYLQGPALSVFEGEIDLVRLDARA